MASGNAIEQMLGVATPMAAETNETYPDAHSFSVTVSVQENYQDETSHLRRVVVQREAL
jgi:hypothetical protein